MVFVGRKIETNEKVAVKVIRFAEKKKKEAKAIRNEILMQKTSRHPNIVEFKACFLKNTELWVVMEYMNGGSLADMILICKMTEPQISCVCKQVRHKTILFFFLNTNNKKDTPCFAIYS